MRFFPIATLTLLIACGEREVSVTEATEPGGAGAVAEGAPNGGATAGGGRRIERPDGLEILVTREGDGEQARAGSLVRVAYAGFVSGSEEPFDSASDTNPMELRLGSGEAPTVIRGLDLGLLGLRAGARATLNIPASLGYGAEGNPPAGVPESSDLIYEVHLLDVR